MHITAPSWALIDTAAYRANLKTIRKRIGTASSLLVSVKANAYGHGMLPIARAALDEGARMLGVATIEEGAELRRAGIGCPILLLFQPAPEDLEAILEHDLRLMACDLDALRRLSAHARRRQQRAIVHCHIDTGMGRQGFDADSAPEALQEATRLSNIDIEGIATHLAQADDPDDPFTHSQLRRFRDVLSRLSTLGVPCEITHAANSAATVNYPESHFDMVRPGIMTYGVWPSTAPQTMNLRPVLQWQTRITQVRHIDAGDSISYRRTYIADRPRTTAILPVGYADGYRVSFSNRASVIVRGQRCPVLGRVCMDQTIIDISGVPNVNAGEIVTLLGEEGGAAVNAEELAQIAGTIPYEIFTGIGSRVLRVPAGEGHAP